MGMYFYEMIDTHFWTIAVSLGALVLFAVLIQSMHEYKRIKQLQCYWNIEIGMSEKEMLSIMRSGYSRSLLKNNRIKYEWRINAKSYNSSFKGASVRNYTGVKKVTIYTRNGYVEEIKSYNV